MVDGEILSKVMKFLPFETVESTETIGETSLLEKLLLKNKYIGDIYSIIDGIHEHGITSVIESLQKER